MAQLVGNSVAFKEEALTHPVNWGAGVPGACQFTATASGTLEELLFITGAQTSTCTSIVFGVFAESSGKPANSSIAEGTFSSKPGIEETIKITGLKVNIISGTKYWLAWLPIGGSVSMTTEKLMLGTTLIENGGSKTTLKSLTWGGTAAVGPATIWGISILPILVGFNEKQVTAQTPGKKIPYAFKLTAVATGTATKLTAKELTAGTNFRMAICSAGSGAGSPKGSTVLAETNTVTKTALEAGITIPSVEVVKGTVYWLIIWSSEAYKILRFSGTEGAMASALYSIGEAVDIKTIIEGGGAWTEETHGPAQMYVESGETGLIIKPLLMMV